MHRRSSACCTISALAVVSITRPQLAHHGRGIIRVTRVLDRHKCRRPFAVIIALAAPIIIPALGFFKAILLGFAIVAFALVTLPAFRGFETWLVIRFLLGVGNSLLFTAGDTWVNQIVDDKVRGRWMGIYVTVGMAGWAVGPILGAYLDPDTLAIHFWPGGRHCCCFLMPARRRYQAEHI